MVENLELTPQELGWGNSPGEREREGESKDKRRPPTRAPARDLQKLGNVSCQSEQETNLTINNLF